MRCLGFPLTLTLILKVFYLCEGDRVESFYVINVNIFIISLRFVESFLITSSRPVVENRQVCLLVDSEEPLMERFVRVASQKGLSAKTRRLPIGDFLWILLPPGANPDTIKDMPDQELVCGFFF